MIERPAVDDGEDLVEALFHGALERPADARAAWLDEACGGDASLRNEVLELLDAHGGAPSAFDDPAWGLGEQLDVEASAASLVGTSIGRYDIRAVLGEGGMGTVYLAEQHEPLHRRVAVKVIKAGMDTAEVVARFDAERRALASLNHGSIASVYDAGTTDRGRPYFVMEYVEGRRITDFCDAERLTVAERVRLFVRVCEAVHHAHGQGLVHRDIKPSNVLVTQLDGEAVPKIIDFGVAKATGPAHGRGTVFTRLGQLVGTPEYMSPEQALDPTGGIDARSDVYSLGVLLYRLVCGVLPLDLRDVRGAGETAVREFFAEADVPQLSERFARLRRSAGRIAQQRRTRPERLVRELAGPLDWILAKALEHERACRYATVSDLADDLRAFLLGEPLLARRPSFTARVARGLRRRRRAVGAAAVLASAVALGAVLFEQLAPTPTAAPSEVVPPTWLSDGSSSSSAPWLVPGRVAIRNDVGEPLVAGEIVAVETLDATGPVALLAARRVARPGDAALGVVVGTVDGEQAPLLDGDWGLAVLHGVAPSLGVDAPVAVGDLLVLDGVRARPADGASDAPLARALSSSDGSSPVSAFVFGPSAPAPQRVRAAREPSATTRIHTTTRDVRAPLAASTPAAARGADLTAALAAFDRRLAQLEIEGRRSGASSPTPLPVPAPVVTGPFASSHDAPTAPHQDDGDLHHDGPTPGGDPHDPGNGTGDDPGDKPSTSAHNSHGDVDSVESDVTTDDWVAEDDDGGDGGGPSFEAHDDVESSGHAAAVAAASVDDAWTDIDGDGLLDVLLFADGVPWSLLRNHGAGRFEDVTAIAGLPVLVDAADVWWRDLDGDTLVDLVVLRDGGTLAAWRNVGRTTFIDASARSRLDVLPDGAVTDVEWLDVEGDGAIDLRARTAKGGVLLGVNDGTGGFDFVVLREPQGVDVGTVSPEPGVGQPGDDDDPPPPGSALDQPKTVEK